MRSNSYLTRVGFAVLSILVAAVMTAAVLFAFLGHARATNQAQVVAAAPFPVTYTVYLPFVTARNDTVYGVEMTAVSDGAGLALMRAAGNTWIHLSAIKWNTVEPTETQRNWSALAFMEQNFLNAQASNMKPVVAVRGTPDWAQLYPPWICGPIKSTKMAAFGNFMYDLVQRYSVPPYNVKYWELGNEPDVDRFFLGTEYDNDFGCWGNRNDSYYGGAYYAEMLKAAYPRIKDADPQAQVLVGGLLLDCDPRLALNANYGCHTAEGRLPPKFLEGILRGGGGPFFDGISFHAYDYFKAPGVVGTYSNTNWLAASNTNGSVILAKVGFLKSVLAQYGVMGKYVMNTEIALLCPSPFTWCNGDQSTPARINFEQTKAYLAAEMYPQAIISDMRSVMWFRNKDDGIGTMSMLNDDLTPRPVYTAFVTSRAFLGDAVYERKLTTADYGSLSNVRGYSFILGSRRIWTLWALDNKTKVLTLPTLPTAAYNQLGATLVVSPNKQLRIFPPYNQFAYVVWDQ
jgi:hypothetical protein